MKYLFPAILFFSSLHICVGQEIKAYKTFGGVRFERDTLTLGLNQVIEILKETPAAYEEIKRAKANNNMAGFLGFAGGLMIGFPVGSAVAGGKPEWGLAAGGVGLILASIPFTTAFRGHTMQALDIYNGKESTSRIKTDFQFYGSGARLIIRF